MALVWKAQWGYMPRTSSIPSHLDWAQFTLTDDTVFGIPTVFNLDGDIALNRDVQAIVTPLESAMGNDYSTIYTFPCYKNSFNIPVIASRYVACPNLYDYITSITSNSQILVCMIKGLNRALVLQDVNSSNPSVTLFNLKTGDAIGLNSIRFFNNNERSTRFSPCFGYDGTVESLTNPNNYKYVSVGETSDEYYYLNQITSESFTTSQQNQLANFFTQLFSEYTNPDYSTPNNPYEPLDPSGPGGGSGTFDGDSDTIAIPSLPTLSSADTGFTRIYNPTLSQVQDLAQYLWTEESVIETIWNHIKQFFENPMEAMIGFNLVPVPVPDGGTETLKILYIDTGVTMNTAASQFVDVDCGSLTIGEYYGSALDYSPYTKVSCFLPFIGTVTLNVDEVMGRTLSITYRVDICSGSCVAYITVDGNAIYQYSGHCAINIPFSAADFSSYVSAMMSVAKLAGAGIVSGAAGVAAEAGEIAATQETGNTSTSTKSGGKDIESGVDIPQNESTNTKASFDGISANVVINTVAQVMGSKPYIEHSGSFSGNSGYLGVRRPFVIIERPRACMPLTYQSLNGYPCMMSLSLGDCSGFTRVQQVRLSGCKATNPEQAEILKLLKGGVVL